jgi:hypothetical protein
MKHPSIRQLFEYWNKPQGGVLPNHVDIEPNAIRGILADTFMLSLPRCRPGRFCAAGTRVCALMGRELNGTDFLDLWSSGSRGDVAELLAIISEESVGVVASASARDLAKAEVTHAAMTLEMLLLPLADNGRTDAGLLGALVPGGRNDWPGKRPLDALNSECAGMSVKKAATLVGCGMYGGGLSCSSLRED